MNELIRSSIVRFTAINRVSNLRLFDYCFSNSLTWQAVLSLRSCYLDWVIFVVVPNSTQCYLLGNIDKMKRVNFLSVCNLTVFFLNHKLVRMMEQSQNWGLYAEICTNQFVNLIYCSCLSSKYFILVCILCSFTAILSTHSFCFHLIFCHKTVTY